MPLNPEFATNPDPRCACVLLLDISGSMSGAAIEALNQGLRAFQSDIQEDALAKRRVEIAIVTFGGSVQTVQDFISAGSFSAPTLAANGNTPMGEAIALGLQLVKNRKAEYKSNGVLYYQPWIFLITDGEPTDEWQSAAQMVQADTAARALAFFAVGVGGANMDILGSITPRAMKLDGLKFRDLFVWLSQSQKRVSGSKPGEQTPLPPDQFRRAGVDGMANSGNPRAWKCLSASVIGTSHIAHQKPCQDAHGVTTLDNGILLVAVADGAGSAKRSDEGSRCVVDTSLQYLAGQLIQQQPDAIEPCEELLRNTIEECRNALVRLGGDKLGDVATTLLLTIVTGQWLSTAQIGDGAVVCRSASGELRVLSDPQRGEYVNETTFLTSSDYRARLHQVTLPSGETNGVAMCSDGIEFLAVRYSDNTAHEPFFATMFDFAGNTDSTEAELVEFLQSERVCERTDDDKTLVLAVRHDTD